MSFEFSNFQPFQYPLIYQGIEFLTVENFFQAMKANKDDLATRRRISTQRVPPSQARRAGRRIKLRPDWEGIKRRVMMYGLRYKFSPYTSWADKLLATGHTEIIEWNTWHDRYWGKCRCDKCGGGGENHLGRQLMEIRGQLAEQKLTPAAELIEWFNAKQVDLGLTMRFEQGRDRQYYVHLSLRNEVDRQGNYLRLGWGGTATYPRFLQNLDFVYKEGSVSELRNPQRWGKVVKLSFGTEVRPY